MKSDNDGILEFGALIFAALLTFAIMAADARAQEHGHDEGHAKFHDVYRTWLIPGTAASCCNAKRTENGVTTGDCYPTAAELRPGKDGPSWWARRDDGVWIEIPEGRIIRERNPDPTGENAHLCYSDITQSVLCFKPPVSGS